MHPNTVSPELQEKIRTTHLDLSASKAAAIFGVGKDAVLKYRKQIPLTGKTETAPELQERITVTTDTQDIFLPKTRIHTLEQLLAYCEVDSLVWEVEKFTANKWEMGYVGKDGAAQTEPLYQVKAFLKRKKNIADAQAEIEALKELARCYAPEIPFEIHNCQFNPPSGNMLEVNFPDLHMGKLAWGVETGGANYDVKIADAVYWRAFEQVLARASHHKYDQVLFVVGNDLLNSDDIEGRTTAGTYVSSDARYHKTFAIARDIIIKSIEKLRSIAPVKVVFVPGNHDQLSVWHLGDSAYCWFSNYQDVEIDNTPLPRKYHQFGKVMLMFTHGNKAKRSDYPLLMATEQSKMFGETKFREAHTGHIHTTKLDEQHGVRVRILPALCAADDWHSQNGFIGNLRSAEGYIWNREQGLIGTAIYTEVD